MVYLAKKDGRVVHHTSTAAMMELDGVSPEMQISDEEFEAAGGLVRVVNGQIFVGKTAAEIAEDGKQAQIEACKAELAEIDKAAGAGRAIRAIALAVAAQSGVDILDVQKVQELEGEADSLRQEIQFLLA